MSPSPAELALSYGPPVDRLLKLGQGAVNRHPWPDYLEFGLTREHVPELIRLATDIDLFWSEFSENEADEESRALLLDEPWAPIHAWRALGQLRAEEAVEPLLALMPELEFTDWVTEEFPDVFGLIGRSAIPALSRYLADDANELGDRIVVARGLREIATRDETARDEAIRPLIEELEKYESQHVELNAFLISNLVELRVTDAAPLMEKAFEGGHVDEFVRGDWEDVQVDLGLLPERTTPRPRMFHAPARRPSVAPPAAHSGRGGKDRSKHKKKLARQSRKQNRRRK